MYGLKFDLLTFLILGYLVLPASVSAMPSEVQVRYEQGNRFYQEGQYERAIEAYQFVVSQAPNGYVYYNLGNAFFKAGKRGWAVWAYERARRLLPRDPDVQANLNYVNSLNEDRFEYAAHPLSIAQIYGRFNLNEWTWFCSAAYALLAILGTVYLVRPRANLWLKRLIGTVAAILLLSLLCLGLKLKDNGDRYGIIVESEAVLYNGPGTHFDRFLTLHEGAKVEILQQRQSWLEIQMPDGRRGWLPLLAIAEI